jgi:hypothetical protein
VWWERYTTWEQEKSASYRRCAYREFHARLFSATARLGYALDHFVTLVVGVGNNREATTLRTGRQNTFKFGVRAGWASIAVPVTVVARTVAELLLSFRERWSWPPAQDRAAASDGIGFVASTATA